jgi:small-conductance mechanosensitive channel
MPAGVAARTRLRWRPPGSIARGLAGLCLALLVGVWAEAQPSGGAPDPSRGGPVTPAQAGVPVRLDGETVFEVRSPLGPFTVEERARAAERRLLRIAEDPFYSEELFGIQEGAGTAAISYRGETVGVVTIEDAARTGGTPGEVASRGLQIAKEAVARYRERRLPQARLRGGILLGAATLLLVGLLVGLRRTHRRLAARVEAQPESGLPLQIRERLRVRGHELVSIELRGLRLLRAAITALALVVYLQFAFAVIPLTRGFALSVLEYLLDPVRTIGRGFLAHVEGLFSILVIVVLTRYLLKALRWLLTGVAGGVVRLPGVSPEWALPLYKLTRLAVLALAAVMIYPYVPGSETAAFRGISLFAGALFTLGATGTAGNLVGGLVLSFMGAFRVGDRIQIGEVTGDVIETTLLLTRIRTIKNEVVTVPNATVFTGQLVNYSVEASREGLILHTSVTIGYDAPWRQVHELLVQAARRTSGILPEPAPFVLQTALNDFFVTYEINAYTRQANDMVNIYGELHQHIQDAFNAAGVEIMSPHFASLRDGNPSTIPGSHRRASEPPRRFAPGVEQPAAGDPGSGDRRSP